MNSLGCLWEHLRKWSYRNANAVVMQTAKGASWARLALKDTRSVVIPNPIVYPLPVDEPRLTPMDWVDNSRKMLLAVGRFSDEKAFDLLLAAFAEVSPMNPEWVLVILGEGPLRTALESQVQGLGLTDRVHLPGRAGNVGEWYTRADLYVMSSRFEGFPNTLGEAMAHGCAAVSYDCDTGPRDLIRHGVDGMLVNPVGNVSALAKSIAHLMQDEPLRARMAAKASEVRERYSIGSVLAMWDKLFEEVMK
jgi:glycosyltransferase involved in cell wall biosynthesis